MIFLVNALCIFHSFLALFMCIFIAANAKIWPQNYFNGSVKYTIVVDSNGYGYFRTIQSAIDSIPPNNNQWVRIFIKAGKYREQIHIPYEKPYIYLQGEGMKSTIVCFDRHDSTSTSGTFISLADNIVVERITFMNSYNYPLMNNKNPITQAVAAMISGDKCVFYRCAFIGLQDTLWDVSGRHYFKFCVIKGGIDFIFGSGQSIYEGCKIVVATESLKGPGYITAQSRSSPTESNGFVFKNCGIDGNGLTFLGRAWGPYARVLFYACSMSNIIVPEGWESWSHGHVNQLTFAEHDCTGEGSRTSSRVKWAYKLNGVMLKHFTDLSYIDGEGWLANQPIKLMRLI
ncbi:hypothetical protein M9H77_12757 [Catharanthus roseus]|uniref:Uncharacterized protein n=1 Tax=Catharanthus roseus TaxID=4058 RepID=A0ACC0BIF4_CATRO|nr:hypothetical protein M9H77_12757 [Catharanthus roseus]